MSELVLESYRTANHLIKYQVAGLVDQYGIPINTAEKLEFAHELLTVVVPARNQIADVQAAVMAKEYPKAVIAEPEFYPLQAAYALVDQAVTPGIVEEHNALSEAAAAHYQATALAETAETVTERLAAAAARHAKNAGRQMVIDTARKSKMRWARRGEGPTTCAFCAMLISRGAVYGERSVRFRSHNHCDCSAVLVGNPKRWQGKAEADRYFKIWQETGNLNDFSKALKNKA